LLVTASNVVSLYLSSQLVEQEMVMPAVIIQINIYILFFFIFVILEV